MSYITSFLSTLPKTQRQAIGAILSHESYRKNIPTLAELLKNINELSANFNLATTNPKPLVAALPSFIANGSKGLEDVSLYSKYDLSSVYTELDNIALLFEETSRLINTEKISIDKRLRELDHLLTTIEIVTENYQDLYSTVVFNAFDAADSSTLSFGSASANYLYTDPRSNDVYSVDSALSLDREREGALLPIDSAVSHKPKGVYVTSGVNTTESDVDFTADLRAGRMTSSTPDNDVRNLMLTDDKVWIHSAFVQKDADQSSPLSSALCEVVVDLGGLKSINYLRVSLATPDTLTINAVVYEAPDGELYTITNQSIDITSNLNLTFSRVVASKVFLQMSQKNYTTLTGTTVKTVQNSPLGDLPVDLQVHGTIASERILNETASLPDYSRRRVSGWLYTFALDELTVGFGEYKSTGIFVSQEAKLDGAIERVLLNSVLTKSTDVSGNPGEAVEFHLHIFEYNDRDELINRYVSPIYPLTDTTVEHEWLQLSSAGIGTLRLFPDVVENFTVYRDFAPLTAGTDYRVSVDGGNTYENDYVYSNSPVGPPYSYKISITAPETTSIYTVTYTPQAAEIAAGYPMFTGSSTITVLETDGSIRFTYPDSRLKLIASSKVYLVVIARSLNADSALRSSCILQDYALYIR